MMFVLLVVQANSLSKEDLFTNLDNLKRVIFRHSCPLNKTYFKILFLSPVQNKKRKEKKFNVIEKNPKTSFQ